MPAAEFEAASVRLAQADRRVPLSGLTRGGPGTNDPSRVTYESVPFARLLMDAYGVYIDQLLGPAWATAFNGSAARYDIQATLPIGVSTEQVEAMLRNLLVARFHLAVHRQPRQVAGYSLVISRSGPRLNESRGPVSEAERGVVAANGEYRLNQPTARGFPELFPWGKFGASSLNGVIRMRFRDFTLPELADHLSFTLAARVGDDTSLRSRYDFTFEFVPPESGIAKVRAVMPKPQDGRLMFLNGPDESQLACVPILSSALEKQLGLRIEPRKLTIDTLVIDHADRIPEEN